MTETGELGQSSFVRDALVPIFSSHKRIASDVMTALDRAVRQWVSEQRSVFIRRKRFAHLQIKKVL